MNSTHHLHDYSVRDQDIIQVHITAQSLQVDTDTVNIIQTYENHAFIELDDELFYQFLILIMIQLCMKDSYIDVCST